MPFEAARLILKLMPHTVAALRRSTFGHSWGCTGKSFSKTCNSNLGIETPHLPHDVSRRESWEEASYTLQPACLSAVTNASVL
jgi:hypothetical protein